MKKRATDKKIKKINLAKKLKIYFFYFKRYPTSIVKAFFFLIFKPKKFFNRLKRIEQIVTPILPESSFNWLSLLSPKKILKGIFILFTNGPKEVIKKIREKQISYQTNLSINQQYQIWLKKNYPTKKILEKQRYEQKKFKYRPKISIITPVYDPAEKFLKECVDSVINQTYDNWELCLVDDASSNEDIRQIIKEYAKKDKRIKYHFRQKNGHICQASNDALNLATGEYIGLLDHDDFLWPNALHEVVKLLNQKPQSQFIYSDEDKLEEDGTTHVDPFFKPDWSPDYLRSINYITHFAVLKKTLVDKVGGFRLGTEGAQDWDLFLRATHWLEKNVGHCHPLDKKNPIQHIPTILYSWRKSQTSTASEKYAGKVKDYAYKNQKKVLTDDLKRRGYEGRVEPTKYLGLWRVRYKITGNPLVSIIIPTKDKYSYISRCLNSILKKTTYKHYELVVVDTGSKDPKVWNLYENIKKKHPNTQVLKWNKEFNFSAVCNFGAEKSGGEYLLFLNNDTEVITPDWIEGMLEHAQRKNIGAVGAKLLYPNNTIQHAGVILGIKGGITDKGVAGHAFKYFQDVDQGQYFQQPHSIKNYSAVTAACLMISKKKFVDFDSYFDSYFKIAFNDVDFCLKLIQKKFFNLYNGQVKLYHYESISVGKPETKNRDLNLFKKEINRMHKKWRAILIKDCFYNINLNKNYENFSIC